MYKNDAFHSYAFNALQYVYQNMRAFLDIIQSTQKTGTDKKNQNGNPFGVNRIGKENIGNYQKQNTKSEKKMFIK